MLRWIGWFLGFWFYKFFCCLLKLWCWWCWVWVCGWLFVLCWFDRWFFWWWVEFVWKILFGLCLGCGFGWGCLVSWGRNLVVVRWCLGLDSLVLLGWFWSDSWRIIGSGGYLVLWWFCFCCICYFGWWYGWCGWVLVCWVGVDECCSGWIIVCVYRLVGCCRNRWIFDLDLWCLCYLCLNWLFYIGWVGVEYLLFLFSMEWIEFDLF